MLPSVVEAAALKSKPNSTVPELLAVLQLKPASHVLTWAGMLFDSLCFFNSGWAALIIRFAKNSQSCEEYEALGAVFQRFFFCLSAGHQLWGLPADQRGIEPPPEVCPFFFGRRHLPFGWSPTLRLTCGPAGNRTTTGSLSAMSKDTALPTEPRGRLTTGSLSALSKDTALPTSPQGRLEQYSNEGNFANQLVWMNVAAIFW